MDISILQESFSAGEISPLAQSRYTSEGYASGCKELLNMTPDSRGPAISRTGTKYIESFTGNNGRIFTHVVSSQFFYSIILLNLELVITGLEGQIPATNYVDNARFKDLGSSWTEGTSGGTVTFSSYLCNLQVSSSPNKYARISQEITGLLAGDYLIDVHTDEGTPYRVDVGTSAGDDTYGTVTTSESEIIVSATIPGTTLWVTVTNDSNDGYDDVHVHYVSVGTDPIVVPTFVTPWAESDLAEVHAIPVPDGDAVYYVHPNYAPRKLVYNISADTFTFTTPTFTSAPSAWTGSNWPSVGTYFQGRLWLGSTPDEPQSLWGSKSGLPEDFTPGTGLDDEAIAIVMASYGRIEWVASTKNLLVGTEAAEHIITSEGGVITPTDHQVDQQSAYGSASIQAQQVGDQIFYISPDRVKLRAMQYEWSADNWLSTDLTYFSEHITLPGIKAVAWAQNPENLFYMVLDDGTFAVLSYDRSNNIYGWSRQDIGGECIDIAVGTISGESVLNMLVKRVDGTLHHESHVGHDDHFVDSWSEHFHITATVTVEDLGYLEGEVVQVVADGALHPDRTVSGGTITLQKAATVVLVGLKFTAKMVMLPVEKGATTGTSAPYQKNLHSLYVHLLDSAHPLVNGDRAPVRSPTTPMGNIEPFTTGKSRINLLGWANETDITIEQDLPLPLTITAVSGKMQQEKL